MAPMPNSRLCPVAQTTEPRLLVSFCPTQSISGGRGEASGLFVFAVRCRVFIILSFWGQPLSHVLAALQ